MFLTHKDESSKVFSVFCKRIQNEKEVIIGENLKMKTFNSFVKNKEFIIIFPIQELFNRMVLWKEKIFQEMAKTMIDNPTFLISTLSYDCFILFTKDNLVNGIQKPTIMSNRSLGTLKIESELSQPSKTKLKWLCF
ncbi:hypothetical protein CR513_00060, partial [Mucuna pruriens]